MKRGREEEERIKKRGKKHLFLMVASKAITGAFEKLPKGGSCGESSRGVEEG